MTTPLISVITVVRNGRSLIQETVDSVLRQDFKDFEYRVFDGASTDGTAELLRSQATRFAELRSEPDTGIYDAMNRAARAAKGEFIYFLNAGDRLYAADTLRTVAAQLVDLDFFAGRVRMTSAAGVDLGRHYPEEGPSFEHLWRSCCIAHQASFLRRALLLELGGFDQSLRSSADYDLWFRLRQVAPRARFSMQAVAWYRDDGLSAHRQTRRIRHREDIGILLRNGVIGPRIARLLLAFNGHPPLRRRMVRWFGTGGTKAAPYA